MIYLRRITSLNNLNTNSIKGQIATILILITVAIMIFILTTINLGRVSIKATQVANAADSAALYLASMLATRAHYYWERLEKKTEKCEKGGILATIFAFVAALIVTVLTWNPGVGFWTYVAIISAATVAGGIGGYIQTGELKGAAMGAIQGMGIGIAFASGAGTFGSCPFVTSLGLEGTITELAIAGTIGAIALGSITTNAIMNELQNTIDQTQENMKNMQALYRGLSTLPEIEQARESVFLMALSQLVDDPNMESDKYDLDDDLDFDEPVTHFENSWWERTLQIRESVKFPDNILQEFFADYLIPFSFGNENVFGVQDFLRRSDRREVECDCSSSTPKDEGPISDMFRRIEASDYDIFWEPGPNRAKLLTKFYKCTDCVPPKGFDSFDAVRLEYEHFIEFVKKLLNPDNCGNFSPDLKELQQQLRPPKEPLEPEEEREEVWLNKLYDPDVTTDYYDIFHLIAHGVDGSGNQVFDENGNRVWGIEDVTGNKQGWIEQLLEVRDQLPGCQLAMGSYIENTNEMVAEYCSGDYPTIYPCNWQRSSVQWDLFPYFPNYACKLYDDILVGGILVQDKNILYNEIGQVRTFVENLTGVVTQISFDGVLHKPGDKTPLGTGKGTITYIEDGVSKTAKLAAPDLFIPNMNKEDFLLALDTFVLILDGTSSTFATIDRDLENEFSEDPNDATGDYVPVIVRLRAEIKAIDDFRPALEKFYNDVNAQVDNRAVYGGGTVRYCWHNWINPDCPIQGFDPDTGNPIYDDCHCVEVETSDFRFPYLKKSHHESWLGMVEKDCLTIKKGSSDGNSTWVRIKRTDWGREKDIASSGIGLGLRWYPGKDWVDIERKSQAEWDENKVGLGGLW